MIRLRYTISVLAVSAALAATIMPASAQLFGPSDEEKAREARQDSAIADLTSQTGQLDSRINLLENKIQSLTDSLSRATGHSEQLSHQLQLQNQKIDAMQKDFAYRICTLSAQQLGVPGDGSDGGLNCAAGGAGGGSGYATPTPQPQSGQTLPPIGGASMPGSNQGASNPTIYDDTPGRGRPPGILGTLPAGGAASGGLGQPARLSNLPPAPPPPQSASSSFDQAMNLLSKAQYTQAAAAFQAYVDANPDDDDLTPKALYWVGNIHYIQHNYAPAERSFAEVLKKFPKSERAPESMLKLGQAFIAGGQKSNGCTTLGLIKSKYPKAPDTVLATATSLRRDSCR
jgi:tol-pal system protein YbgF